MNGGRWTVQRGARYTRLFKYGKNPVEFRVTKRVRRAQQGQCQHGSPARPLGIFFNLAGDFKSDLWLSNDRNVIPPPTVERRNPGNPGLVVFVRPRNLGPSGAYMGELAITFSSTNAPSTLVPGSVSVTGAGIRNCQPSINPIRIKCEVYRFQAGATPVVQFTVTVELAPGYSQVYATAGATIFSHTRDAKSISNGWTRQRIFCGPTATDPKCPPP